MQLTVYKNSFDKKGYKQPSTISKIVDIIRSDKYKELTETLRSITDKTAAYEFKRSKFVAVTFSGTFSARNTVSLVKHSGFICIDIDKLTPEDYDRLLVNLPKDTFTHVLFTSPSGDGFKLIVKIDCQDHKTHKEIYFPSLVKYYKDNYQVAVDPTGSNVDRLCYIPYDPNVFINEDSYVFYSDLTEDEIITSSRSSFESDTEFTIKNIVHCITDLKIRAIDITQDYAQWVRIGFAFASLGEAGRNYYHQVSSIYPNYDSTVTDKKFDNFLATNGNKITISTFFFACKEYGIELVRKPIDPQTAKDFKELYSSIHEINRAGRYISDLDIKHFAALHLINPIKIRTIADKIFEENKEDFGLNDKPEIFRVERFIKETFDIQKNEVTAITEFRRRNKGSFTTINKNTIYRELLHTGFKFSFEKLKAILGSEFVTVINPFNQYFETLPTWDNEDHIANLAAHVKTDNDLFWHSMFKKALVRSIACAIGGIENRIIMVLVQEDQETGKTSFIRFLNPFGSDYYTESPLRDSKDIEFRFAENFIYNLEELSSLHALDINKLKAIISKSTIKERRAYAEYEEKAQRRCNFWGSTNKSEFLTDITNSRWLCFNVLSINHDYNNYLSGVKSIDIHKVWAQAYNLYKSGFNYSLDTLEKAQRDENNKGYEQTSDEKELLVLHFRECEDEDTFITLVEIQESLLSITKNRVRINRYALIRALSQLGWKSKQRKISKVNSKVYALKLTTALDAPVTEETPF